MSRAPNGALEWHRSLYLSGCEDVYYLLADYFSVEVSLATIAVENLAGNHRVEGVVVANLYVVTSLNLGAALAHDNHAWTSSLAVTKLDSKVFRV